MKDIYFYLLVVVFSAQNEPHGAGWRLAWLTLMPGATNWHIPLVCRKPPTRHTCYMHVAKNDISAPLLHIVWTQQSVPLSTCVSVFTHTQCNTHLQLADGREHVVTHKESILTQAHAGIAGHLETNRCSCAVEHTQTEGSMEVNTYLFPHSHLYAFT